MISTIFICLMLFLGGVRTSKIGFNETVNFDENLKICLSTLVEKFCPNCTTLHLIIPPESTWQADALANYFSDSSRMYAIAVNTIDQPNLDNPSFDRVYFYLVNAEDDLMMALKHLSRTNSGRNCVVLVNFYFGCSLGGYLQRMIPVNWSGEGGLRVVFTSSIEGGVQVFERESDESFRQLDICDTNGLIESHEADKKSVLEVSVHPSDRPYVERRTDNPGGVIGNFMKVLEKRFNLTIKFVWSVRDEDLFKYAEGDGKRLVFELHAKPKTNSKFSSPFLSTEGVWLIVTPDPFERRNILALPFKESILLHVVLFAIYTVVMVYLSKDLDRSRIMLRLFGMFLGVGVGWLPRTGLYRFLLMLWCFTTYNVLVQVYFAMIASSLSVPMARKSFQDTDDLMKSGFDILCTEVVKNFYCDQEMSPDINICDKCVCTKGNKAFQLLSNNTLQSTETWRSFALSVELEVLHSRPYSKFITVMDERIGSWPSMMYSNAQTEIFPMALDISVRLNEAGLFQYWIYQHSAKRFNTQEFDQTLITMQKLNGVFVVLYFGWAFSFLVFLIELLMKWYRK